MNKEDRKQIETARKYGLNPGTLKCQAFALFDEEYSPKEVKYPLRRYAISKNPRTLTETVRKYYHIWSSKQRA